jgi:hypothetical protein
VERDRKTQEIDDRKRPYKKTIEEDGERGYDKNQGKMCVTNQKCVLIIKNVCY